MCALLSTSSADLLGKSALDFVPRGEQAEIVARWRQSASREPVASSERRLLRANGDVIDVEVTSWAVPCLNGFAVRSSFVDLTERNRSEEALRDSQATVQALLESASQAILAVTRDGRIVLANAMAERMFGWTRGELLNLRIEALLPEHFRDTHLEHRRKYFADPRVRPMGVGLELTGRRRGGANFPVEISLSYVRTKSDTLAVAFVTDITARKRVEDELNLSRERLALAQKAGSIGILDWSMQTGEFFWSEELGLLLGRRDPPSGEGIEEWRRDILPEDLRAFEDALDEATARQERDLAFDYRVIRPDGAIRWISGRGHLYYDDSGVPRRLIASNVDMTDQREFEERLRLANEALQRSNEDLQQFAYAASHDLQEPLRMITAYSQLLTRRYYDRLDQQANEYIAYVVESAARMRSMLESLLAYSRAVHAHREKAGPVSSAETLHHALLNLTTAVEQSGAIVTFDELPPVLAQEVHLIQVFQNLIGNAIKYRSEATPKVHVTSQLEANFVRFTISDNGVGIAPEYHKRVFGIFKRLHGRDVSGAGIGLAICSRIVERYGGRIWVESEPGSGARFHFTLPAA